MCSSGCNRMQEPSLPRRRGLGLQASGFGVRGSGSRVSPAYYSLLTACCLLLTAECSLLTCSLLTARPGGVARAPRRGDSGKHRGQPQDCSRGRGPHRPQALTAAHRHRQPVQPAARLSRRPEAQLDRAGRLQHGARPRRPAAAPLVDGVGGLLWQRRRARRVSSAASGSAPPFGHPALVGSNSAAARACCRRRARARTARCALAIAHVRARALPPVRWALPLLATARSRDERRRCDRRPCCNPTL